MSTSTSVPKWYQRFVPGYDEQPIKQSSTEISDEHSTISECYDEREAPLNIRSPGVDNASLFARELGSTRAKSSIESSVRRDIKPFRAWTGASKDILSVAWSADSDYFAIGASSDFLDRTALPYNRNNNLLFGTVASNELHELPDHHITRSAAIAALQSQSASEPHQSLSAPTAPQKIFTSVSCVSFAQHHQTFYSAGYDKTVRVWQVPRYEPKHGRPQPLLTLRHEAHVEYAIPMPSRSPNEPRVLATAQRSREKSIKLFGLPGDTELDDLEQADALYSPIATFSSERALNYNITPSSLKFGPDHVTRRYLLAGFAENSSGALRDREGHVAIFDINRSNTPWVQLHSANENVFSVAWQPGRFIFGAATTPRNARELTHRYDAKSVIRTWSPTETLKAVHELECPARDVNDLMFHPNRDSITASCTDGRIYVWDCRRPNKILATLEHGKPIETFKPGRREEDDVGVRFTTWAQNGRYLYTGSSDGRLACWDVLATGEFEEASVQQVAQFDAGIMEGAFSSDESKLLLGLVKGSIEILSIGACSSVEADSDKYMVVSDTERAGTFAYVPAESDDSESQEKDEDTEARDAARELLASGQLVQDPNYGVGQGPNYQGPWSMPDRPAGCVDPRTTSLLPDVAAQQFDEEIRRKGRENGGWAPNATRNRRLAQECQKNVARRSGGSDRHFDTSCNIIDEERVRGPDVLELTSLAELERFGNYGDEETGRPIQSFAPSGTPARIRPVVPIKQEVSSPAKRRADEEIGPHGRKRSQTPRTTLARELIDILEPPPAESPLSHQPGSADPADRPRDNRNNEQSTTHTSAPAGQPVIIDLCDSSDQDDPVMERPASVLASQGHRQGQEVRTSGKDGPSPAVDAAAFIQPTTPSRRISRSPAVGGSPQPGHTMTRPSQRPSSTHGTESRSPSSQRSVVIPASPGKHGFVIPPRILRPGSPRDE